MSDEHLSSDLRIVRGAATEEELAALIAVVTDAYEGEATDAVVSEKRLSAWQQTQRPMRKPLRRDIPWGRFSG